MVAVSTLDDLLDDPVLSLGALPVDPDEGFPQSFLLGLGGRSYRVEFYLAVAESELPRRGSDPTTMIDVSGAGGAPDGPRGSLIGAVIRQDAAGDVPLLRRRLLPGLAYRAGDLVLAVQSAALALGNLNGAGAFGSSLVIKVGTAPAGQTR